MSNVRWGLNVCFDRGPRGRWVGALGGLVAGALSVAGCSSIADDKHAGAEEGAEDSGVSAPAPARAGDQTVRSESAPAAAEGSDFLVNDMAQARGVSLSEASHRLDLQAHLPGFESQVATDLGARSAGIWVDTTDEDRIKVGVTDMSGLDLATLRPRWIAASGMRDFDFDVVVTRYSWDELDQANNWLADEIVRVNEGASATLAAGIATNRNAVILHAPGEELMNEEQRAVVAAAHARLGEKLLMGDYGGEILQGDQACSDDGCNPPARGGMRISDVPSIGQWNATTGFSARSGSGTLYMLTAGHSAKAAGGNTIPWNTITPMYGTLQFAITEKWTFSDRGDQAILRISSSGWNPQNMVYVRTGAEPRNETLRITATATTVSGRRLCMSGASSRRTVCGNTLELNQTQPYGGVTVKGLVSVNYCRNQGDSGGPVFGNSNFGNATAYGLHVAGVGTSGPNCTAYVQPIGAAARDMGVTVLTAAR
jgi:hypothetical protein